MLRLVDDMKHAAVALAAQGSSLQDQAKNITDGIRKFRTWATEAQKASLDRYEAVRDSLAEHQSHEAAQYDSMITLLDAIIASVADEDPTNG